MQIHKEAVCWRVEPFLRTVQGRDGILDFRVVCNETNNPGDVIDRNEFVGDIFVKPNPINFIQLNFVAYVTGSRFLRDRRLMI